MRANRIRAVVAGALALSLAAMASRGQTEPSGERAMPFTKAQVSQGRSVYDANCAACHGAGLDGGPGSPPLKGGAFRLRYQSQTGDALYRYIAAQMPPGNAGRLAPAQYAALVALILEANGGKAGANALPDNPEALRALSLAATLPPMEALPPETREIPQSAPPDRFVREAEKRRVDRLARIRPVTDAMLRTPPDEDWNNPRRTQDAHAFSPLAQIDAANVGNLEVAWTWSLPTGPNEITPLVHDGVVFVASGGSVQAIDGTSGELLWEYKGTLNPGVVRNIGIYGDKLIVPGETEVIALDLRSGAEVWKKSVVPSGFGARLTGGPLIVKGIVLQGVGMCVGRLPGGCYLIALDAQSGKELWRFNSIARPGQPGGDSWNGAPVDERFGGGIWIAPSYDPELDLVIYGTGQTYKLSTLLKDYRGDPGGNDGLFTDSTIALRPETGQLAWYYQHLQRDVWDVDWAFERTIATLVIDGKPRRTVTTAGKLNIFDTLDAATGEYLFSYDVGLQNLIQSIDPTTGVKTVRRDLVELKPNVPQTSCPSTLGGRNWMATAFNAKTGILFVPENETCHTLTYVPGNSFDFEDRILRRIDSDGMIGRVEAIDLASRKTLWVQRRRAPQSSAILATAGGLIFEGSHDRWFRASDQRSGKVLWQTRLNAPPSSYPVTYGADGDQYVAVVAGTGGALAVLLGSFAPEIAKPPSGTTLWVFRLKDGTVPRKRR